MSGHERNRLFLSRGGVEFLDASGVSGLDDPADGRAFGILDYDRDGFADIALVNSNAPWVELFHNRAGLSPGPTGGMVALRFVGGNDTPFPSKGWSARDAVGAVARVRVEGRELLRELRAGEGFASQNSATLIVGLGQAPGAESIAVRFPSGVERRVDAVPAGRLVTVYEDPADSPTKEVFVVEPYGTLLTRGEPLGPAPRATLALPPRGGGSRSAKLNLYTTMATWCVACRGELPRLARLRDAFDPSDVAMFGVPIDVAESRELVEAWVAEHQPVYDVRTDLAPDETARVRTLVLERLKVDAVPASILTDAAGNVLRVQWGPPSLSKLRELVHAVTESPTPDKASLQP